MNPGPLKKHLSLPVPTFAAYVAYTGGHTHKKWAAAGEDWRCPSCLRSKFEQLTWTRSRRIINRRTVYGEYIWLAPIVQHHDHGGDGDFYRRIAPRRDPRFAPTLICFDCNIAEGRIKRVLELPSDFSFSPTELREIITGYPHRRVTEDLEKARLISESLLRFRF